MAPSSPYPTLIATCPCESCVLGFTRRTTPLLKSADPTFHSRPVLVAYSIGVYPSRSLTVTTAIWFEVVSSNAVSVLSSSSAWTDVNMPAKSFTSLGGEGALGIAEDMAAASSASTADTRHFRTDSIIGWNNQSFLPDSPKEMSSGCSLTSSLQ